MKKILSVICVLAVTAGAASAQSGLGKLLNGVKGSSTENSSSTVNDILNAASGVVGALTSNSNVDLTGTWTYNGVALALESDNALSSLASSAAASTLEGKIDEALTKIGINKGSSTFEFTPDGKFSISAGKVKLGGTWTKTDSDVQLNFDKLMSFLKLKGTIVTNSKGGCQILFESGKFLTFLQKALAAIGTKNATASTVSQLISNYNNLKLGFKLSN